MTRRAKTTIIVSLQLLLVSCSGFQLNPPGPETQTILILPFTAENTSGAPYGYYYGYPGLLI